MEATDGFDNRSTGFLALKCGKVILTARLHYLLEGSPKVRFELTRGHPLPPVFESGATYISSCFIILTHV